MSHFPVIVLVPPDADATEEASKLLAPYDEGGEWNRDGSRWDWWQVGGRWTGSLTGYSPEDDPANVVVCDLCHGMGRRPDAARFGAEWEQANGGCNGCQGTGKHVAWPTEWKEYDGDILPIAQIKTEFVPTAVVTPDGAWHEEAHIGWFGTERERHESPGDWRQRVARLLFEEHPDHVAVLVDCHV